MAFEGPKPEYIAYIMSNPSLARQLVITESQESLLNAVKKKDEFTSRYVAKKLGISIQSASGRIRELYRKGYLYRRNGLALSGGKEYWYWHWERGHAPPGMRNYRSG